MRIPPPLPRKRVRLELIPLIDIMFFLLATFIMVSLSMIQNRGIALNLPGASSGLPQAQAPSVTLSYTADGRLFWDKEAIDRDELKARLLSLVQGDPDPKVVLHADAKAAYGDVVGILDLVKAAGVRKVALRTRALEGKP